ncbi:DUF1592 domain-containing protein [Akkermansiaceae bacterium]|nr:DUF1592 domain-containing protein [Akkermansiaceae bacterium]
MVFHAPVQPQELQRNINTAAPKLMVPPGGNRPPIRKAPAPYKKKSSFVSTLVTLSAIGMVGYAGFQVYTQSANKEAQQEVVEVVNGQVFIETPEETAFPTPEVEIELPPAPEISAVLASETIADISHATNEQGELLISHFDSVVEPFVTEHCLWCHGPDKEKGDFRIDKLMNKGLIRSEGDAEHWQEILDLINTGEMPPPKEDQPSKDELTAMLDALYETTANARDVIASKGNGVMRRLNSREYAHVIKDLVGLTVPEGAIPEDRGIQGFDTHGADLSTTSAELQAYIDVSYDLMQALTYSYGSGGDIPEEARDIFRDIPKVPTNSHARAFFQRFVVKLYSHQPVPVSMIKDMTTLFNYNRNKGASFWEAATVSLTCALTSPNLIFIVERETELDQFDIANRLSLLLWSSVPDRTLINLARKGEFTNPEVYAEQFERMINDSKADRFFDTFTDQWLELDRLDVVNIDEGLFPQLKEQEDVLKDNMTQETKSFIRHLITENRPAHEIVNADYTMLNKVLAKHYGLKAAKLKKDEFSKVVLEGEDKVRGGILGQGSIQMLTANGARTSPVERGVFILRKLLDSSPPPAPADVPEVEDVPAEGQTTRELLKHHMTTAQCATCHAKIDPLGFGMESFGPIGRWRTHEGELPIDSSGQMTNGKKFDDYQGLISNLAVNDERIAKSFVKAIMSYAIGRKVRYTDSGDIEKIIQSSRENQFKLKDLIYQVVTSETFKTKR